MGTISSRRGSGAVLQGGDLRLSRSASLSSEPAVFAGAAGGGSGGRGRRGGRLRRASGCAVAGPAAAGGGGTGHSRPA